MNCFGGDANTVSHRPVGRGRAPEGTSWTGSRHEFDNPTSADATAYTTQRNGGSRKFHWWTEKQQKLLAVFGWLSCIQDPRLLVDGKCISDQYHEDECPGCCQCSRLICEICRDSQDKNNPFRLAEGSRVFKVDIYKEHERTHHPKVEEVRNIKTAVAQAELLETDRMVRVFLLVYWLASEALPMLKIYTLARLISLLQFRDAANCVMNVGNNYVNHMAAKDMTMSMAAVLREWINARARLSPVLGLMIDESTDISNHKVLLLYLRFLVDGRYVTMFWAALSVVDATAQGLLDVIEKHFEAMKVSMERGLHLQGFIRGRKVVQLFKHPDGWCEGMFTRRCIRKGQPSDIYSIKYDDGFEYNQPCERRTYGTGLGKKWCIIQPIS